MEIPVQLQIVRMMIYEEAIVEGLAPEDMSMTIALVKLETEIPVMKEAVAMEGEATVAVEGEVTVSMEEEVIVAVEEEVTVPVEGEATVVMEGGKGTLTLHGGGKQTWIHPQ